MMIPKRKLIGLALFVIPFFTFAQENSPYSRYGIGNIVPTGNILNRGMGGISAGYVDGQSINFTNPASYSFFAITPDPSKFQPPTLFDIGAEVDSRTLRSLSPVNKFTANNAIISYLQFAFPLTTKKMGKKDISWGLNFGLRPVSKVNYKIEKFGRITNIDSLATIYEGSGGVNQAFVGTGVRIKNFSFGINTGYLFGNKDYGTRLIFINDTVSYYASYSATKINFGGLFVNAGVMYSTKIKNGVLRIGAYGNLQQQFNATKNVLRQTFIYNSLTGNPDKLDSVFEQNNIKGKIQLPATYGVGFTVEKKHWLIGLDFEATNWSNYRLFNETDVVKNSWIAKAGVQYNPANEGSSKYFNYVKYRAGFYFGPDYINVDKNLPQYGVSVGASFPLKLRRSFYETQYSILNTSIEYGTRGNKNNNIRENILRIGVGFSLSDIWFRRYKYD